MRHHFATAPVELIAQIFFAARVGLGLAFSFLYLRARCVQRRSRFARDFVPQHQSGLGGRTTTHHVLVGATDVGRADLQNDAVLRATAPRSTSSGVGMVRTSTLPCPTYTTPRFPAINVSGCLIG